VKNALKFIYRGQKHLCFAIEEYQSIGIKLPPQPPHLQQL
jgi:hypothetical protein